jgi:hypothetical protein
MDGVGPPLNGDSTRSRAGRIPEALRLQLHPGIASVSAVRGFLQHACSGALSPERLKYAELLAAELVADALRYGAAGIWMEIERAGDTVLIAVCDRGSASAPTPRHESACSRGLLAALSEQWGVTALDHSKSVWFTLVDVRDADRGA